MRIPLALPRLGISLLLVLISAAPLWADEGMWLFNDPPLQILQDRHEATLDQTWLDSVQRSSVRFNNGGSGSFVSPRGLVLTNHHVASDAIQKLSTPERDLLAVGYLARTQDEELPTKDLELNVLLEIEDVTEKVRGALTPEMSAAEAEAARRAILSRLEKESLEATGLRSDVVTLFRGGSYHLYRYKRYTDVRLVFAPEIGIAFYGGDTDNFGYPRYCLDMALFRVYEDGKPVTPEHFLSWNPQGAEVGQLTFVSGHPGRTERLNTVANLEYLRDHRYPLALQMIRRLEVLLRTYSERNPENKRRAQDELFGYQNARKAYLGGLEGLQDPALFRDKKKHEDRVRAELEARPDLKEKYGDPHGDIEKALAVLKTIAHDHYLLESGRAFNTELFDIARHLYRYQTEQNKPNEERLREYRDSALESLKQQLFSEAPIHKDLEAEKLADSLAFLVEMRGADDPLVVSVLDGLPPRQRSFQLVHDSRLDEVAVRQAIWSQQQSAPDPLLELAALVDQQARKLRTMHDTQISGPMQEAYGRLAQLEHELGVTAGYPDATFTLRLSFGPILPYEVEGEKIDAFTTFRGLYEKGKLFEQAAPYTIPERWLEAKSRLDLDTPFNFVSTPDITGGNSGSPVVDLDGHLVGLIFDGNIESLVLDFRYEDQVARAVSVDVRGMLEALSKVYQADFLVEELLESR